MSATATSPVTSPSSASPASSKKAPLAKKSPAPTRTATTPAVQLRKLNVKPLATLNNSQPNVPDYAPPHTAHPPPQYPAWSLAKAQKEAAIKAQYTDGEHGQVLPASLAALVSGWKRIGELRPPDKVQLTPNELGALPLSAVTVTHPLLQDNAWSNTVGAYFNLMLTKRNVLFGSYSSFVTDNLQPQLAKDSIPRYSDKSKYIFRIFHQNEWKMIAVDDYIPVDAQGNVLFPSAVNEFEVWPWLLCKVLCKIWKADEFANGGAAILYTFCGVGCQQAPTDTVLTQPIPIADRPKSPMLPFDASGSNEDQPISDGSTLVTDHLILDGGVGGDASSLASTFSASLNLSNLPNTSNAPLIQHVPNHSIPRIARVPNFSDSEYLELSRLGLLGWYNELYYQQYNSGDDLKDGLLFGVVQGQQSVTSSPHLSHVLGVEADQVNVFGSMPPLKDAPSEESTNTPLPASPAVTSVNKSRENKEKEREKEAVAPSQEEHDHVTTIFPTSSPLNYYLIECFNAEEERSQLLALEVEVRTEMERRKTLGSRGTSKTPNSVKKPAVSKPSSTSKGSTKKKRDDDELARRVQMEQEMRKCSEDEKVAEMQRAKTQRAKQRLETWLRGDEQQLYDAEIEKTTPKLKITNLLSNEQHVVRIDIFCKMFEQIALFRDPSRYAFFSSISDMWREKEWKKPYTSTGGVLFVPDALVRDNNLLTSTIPIASTSAQLLDKSRHIYLHLENMVHDTCGGGTSEVEDIVLVDPSLSEQDKMSPHASAKDKKTPVAKQGAQSKLDRAVSTVNGKKIVSDGEATTILQPPAPDLSQWRVVVEQIEWGTNAATIVASTTGTERLGLLELVLPPPTDSPIKAAVDESGNESDSSSVVGGAGKAGKKRMSGKDKQEKDGKAGDKDKDKDRQGEGSSLQLQAGQSVSGSYYRITVHSGVGYVLQAYSHAAFALEEVRSKHTTTEKEGKGGNAVTSTTTGHIWDHAGVSCKSFEGVYSAQAANTPFTLFRLHFEVPRPYENERESGRDRRKKIDGGNSAAQPLSARSTTSDTSIPTPRLMQQNIPATQGEYHASLATPWLSTVGNGVCQVVSASSPAPQQPSLLLHTSLTLLDSSLSPYVRLEFINNDTLATFTAPLLEAPSLRFAPNTSGYTIQATALCPHASVYSGKWVCRLLSDAPITPTVESTVLAAFTDEYKHNHERSFARFIASTNNAQLSLASMFFTASVPQAGLLCKVYDLDGVLEQPLHSPPPPLITTHGLETIYIPALNISKDQRVLVEVHFDALYPTSQQLADGPIKWTAKFLSPTPIQCALDKAGEDELLAIKLSFGVGGDNSRAKKARASRESYLEQRALQQQSGGESHKEKENPRASSTKEKDKKDVPVPKPRPSPPIIKQADVSVVRSDTMVEQSKQLLQGDVEKGAAHSQALQRYRDALTDLALRNAETRETEVSEWRGTFESAIQEHQRGRSEYRRQLITEELAMQELRTLIAQQPPPDELTSPFHKESGKEKRTKKEEARTGLAGYVDALINAIPPIAALPTWKGSALLQQAVMRLQTVLADSIQVTLQTITSLHPAAVPLLPTTPVSSSRNALNEKGASSKALDKERADRERERERAMSLLWNAVVAAREISSTISTDQDLRRWLVAGEVFLYSAVWDAIERCAEPGILRDGTIHMPVDEGDKSAKKGSKEKEQGPDYHGMEQWLLIASKFNHLHHLTQVSEHDEHADLIAVPEEEGEDVASATCLGELPNNMHTVPITLSQHAQALPPPAAQQSYQLSVNSLAHSCALVSAAVSPASSDDSAPPSCGLCFYAWLMQRAERLGQAAQGALAQYGGGLESDRDSSTSLGSGRSPHREGRLGGMKDEGMPRDLKKPVPPSSSKKKPTTPASAVKARKAT